MTLSLRQKGSAGMNLITTFLKGQSVFQTRKVTPSAQTVYHTLIRLQNQAGWATVGIKTSLQRLKSVSGLGKRATIHAYVNELIDCGLLTIERTNGTTNKATMTELIVFSLTDSNAPVRRSRRPKQQQQAAATQIATALDVFATADSDADCYDDERQVIS